MCHSDSDSVCGCRSLRLSFLQSPLMLWPFPAVRSCDLAYVLRTLSSPGSVSLVVVSLPANSWNHTLSRKASFPFR